jgi:pyridoxal phosphate enzyme (YggS family)
MMDVAANVAAVRTRIARAAERAKRDAADIVLVAAAKMKSAELVDAAIAAGVTDIGENYVQEAAAKQSQVRGVARWYMIGHLQRNKVARAAAVFDAIQTIDSVALGEAVSRQGESIGRTIDVLIEVNVAGESTKSGGARAMVPALVGELAQRPGLRVKGLMTIPPAGSPEDSRRYFRQLRELAEELSLDELSMGMTADFEVAIEEGATMVRVGRAIFGERE